MWPAAAGGAAAASAALGHPAGPDERRRSGRYQGPLPGCGEAAGRRGPSPEVIRVGNRAAKSFPAVRQAYFQAVVRMPF